VKPATRFFWFVFLLAGAPLAKSAEPPALPKIRYTEVAPGLDYAHVRVTNQPWSIHIARLDRRKKNFEIVTTLGKGTIQGLASLSKQIEAFPHERGRPLAAINGSFYHIQPGPYQGDPEGLQILDGELVSAPTDKCFWAETNGQLHIEEHIYSRFTVTWPDGTQTPLDLNESPRTNAATLFTPTFGARTDATNVTELVLEKVEAGPWLPLRVDETYRARIREIRPTGNTPLSPPTMILAVTGHAATNLATLKPGDVLTLATATSRDIHTARAAIGGQPVLVHDGVEQKWPERQGITDYLRPRHPRTGLGFNARYFFLAVVDGRQPDLSIGMSYAEWSAFFKQLGCTDALNLDGGGSATFWLNGHVMNSPSDKRERSLANAVMIVQKAK
jgi:hypothetical protein